MAKSFHSSLKIIEFWGFGQAVPAKMVNENGMF
jgi:hypothetical protein